MPEKIQWEYLSTSGDLDYDDGYLDRYGEDGWELVSVISLGQGRVFLYFKRPKIASME